MKTRKKMKFKFFILSCFSNLFFKKVEDKLFERKRKQKKCSTIKIKRKITYPNTSVFCFFFFCFFVTLFFVFAKFNTLFFYFYFPKKMNDVKKMENLLNFDKKTYKFSCTKQKLFLFACL